MKRVIKTHINKFEEKTTQNQEHHTRWETKHLNRLETEVSKYSFRGHIESVHNIIHLNIGGQVFPKSNTDQFQILASAAINVHQVKFTSELPHFSSLQLASETKNAMFNFDWNTFSITATVPPQIFQVTLQSEHNATEEAKRVMWLLGEMAWALTIYMKDLAFYTMVHIIIPPRLISAVNIIAQRQNQPLHHIGTYVANCVDAETKCEIAAGSVRLATTMNKLSLEKYNQYGIPIIPDSLEPQIETQVESQVEFETPSTPEPSPPAGKNNNKRFKTAGALQHDSRQRL